MNNIPTITRNLLLINIICFLVQQVLQLRGINVTDWLGLHFVLASQFNVLQLISYMFLHGSWTHLFFNMFSLWMFGRIIESTLGAKRYLLYYMVCGIGAGLCQELWQTADYFIHNLSAYEMVDTGRGALMPMSQFLNSWTTIGASGACYGILLAFGALFPNERIMLLIPPIPMKAKYFVAGYAAIELFSAYTSNDNVAHFAHLGGMLFGWLLLRYWRKQTRQRQQFSGWQTWPNEQQRHSSWWQRLQRIFKRMKQATPTTPPHAKATTNTTCVPNKKRLAWTKSSTKFTARATIVSRPTRRKNSSALVDDSENVLM